MENQNYTEQENAMVKHIDEWLQKSSEVREECIDVIRTIVKKCGVNTANDTYELSLCDEDGDYIGGITSFAYTDDYGNVEVLVVESVVVKNNHIFLKNDDIDDYDIDYIQTYEVVTLAEHILEVKEYVI